MARAVKKAYIYPKNNPQNIMQFQYNPESFDDASGVNFAEMNSPGMSYPMYQYVGGKTRVLNLQLFLDAYEDPTREAIKKQIRFLHSFLPAANSGKLFTKPPEMILAWGWFVKPCILTDLVTTYTMFDSNLNPIRATADLTLNILQ